VKKICAVDPGNEQSAFVVWDGSNIQDKGLIANKLMVNTLANLNLPTAIEMVASYGMPVGRTVFNTCVWIGIFGEAVEEHVTLVLRSDVKMYLCQSMRAKDSNIRQSLIDRLGPPGTKKNQGKTYGVKKDIWAALALAVTWWDSRYVENSGATIKPYDIGGHEE